MTRIFSGLATIVIFSVLSACKQQPETTDSVSPQTAAPATTTPAKSAFPSAGTMKGDSIFITGKYILFFGTGKEIADAAEQARVTSFKNTASLVIDSLHSAKGPDASYTLANHIVIYKNDGTSMVISRTNFKEQTGVLLMDGGQPPLIRKGILELHEYHDLIADYFLTRLP